MTPSQWFGVFVIVFLLVCAIWCMWQSKEPGQGHDADNGFDGS